jgi:eukaryotic-like serine/threonine-protein kinase
MANAAHDLAAASGGVALGDYQLYPEHPLPGLSVGNNVAYRATARERPELAFFALVCDPAAQPRIDVMPAIRKSAGTALLTPLEWQVIDWPPSARRSVAIVFDRPEDGRFVASLGETVAPLGDEAIIRDYLMPIVSALRALNVAGIVHGAVNPTNLLFREAPRRGVVLGECVSTALAARQPGIFLPIEAALAAPAARGRGQLTDDVFALGATAAFLMLGGNPAAGIPEDDLLRTRIDIGSYGAIIGDRRVPVGIVELLRGLLADDPKLRWSLSEVDEWLISRRFVLRQGIPMRRATRPFEFDGRPYVVPRALSHAFARNSDAAVEAVKSRDFEIWAHRALSDETSIALVKAAQNEGAGGGPPNQRDAALVARMCIALDWHAPVRYRTLAAAIDGFGGALASAFLAQAPIQTIAEAIAQRLPQFWLGARSPPPSEHITLLKLFERLRVLLDDGRLGCGIERVLYELNPTLHCLSPLIEKDHVFALAGFLPAIEKHAASRLDGDLFDRHSAAFVAARFKTAASGWVEGLASGDPAERLVSILRVLARLQAHGGPPAVPNLVKWAARQAAPLVETYHHRPTRQHLTQQFEKAAQAGRLVDLMLIIDNAAEEQRDADGFIEAKRAHAAVAGELSRLAASAVRRPQQAAILAGQMAASFATLVAVAASLAFLAVLVLG